MDAVRKALSNAEKLDAVAEELLNSFINATVEVSETVEGEKPAELTKKDATEPAAVIKPVENLPLFEITELNGIEDRMTRGMAKKIYTAGKRAEKTRIEVIVEIREALNSAGKLDESTAAILANLESGN